MADQINPGHNSGQSPANLLRLFNQIEAHLQYGRFPQAHDLLDLLKSMPITAIKDKIHSDLLWVKWNHSVENFQTAIEIGLESYGQALKNKLYTFAFKIGLEIADSYSRKGDDEDAQETLGDLELLLHSHFSQSEDNYVLLKSYLYFIQSGISWHLGRLDEALTYITSCVDIRQKLGSKSEIADSLSLAGMINCEKGNYIEGTRLLREALILQNELGNQHYISILYNNLGWMFRLQGDIANALRYLKRSIKIREKITQEVSLRIMLANLGVIYRQMGKFAESEGYLLRALKLGREMGNSIEIALFLYYLVFLRLDQGQLAEAKALIDEIQIIGEKTNNEKIKQRYLLAQGLYLKQNMRVRNVYMAQQIFREIANNAIIKHELTVEALVNLCDLLIFELKISDDEAILQEITQIINRLLEIAKELRSYYLSAEIKFLKAKLALLSFDIDVARNLMGKAQIIAEEQGLSQLAIKISNAHDLLLEQQKMWEKLQANPPAYKERVQLANIDADLARIMRQGIIEPDEVIPEKPLLVVVLNESGPTLFSYQFEPIFELNDQLFGGILSAFDSFSHQVFHGVLERAKFGQYSILVKKHSPILLCYVYEGFTYYARKKFSQFCAFIEESPKWMGIFENAIANGNLLPKDDYPELNSQIELIFTQNERE